STQSTRHPSGESVLSFGPSFGAPSVPVAASDAASSPESGSTPSRSAQPTRRPASRAQNKDTLDIGFIAPSKPPREAHTDAAAGQRRRTDIAGATTIRSGRRGPPEKRRGRDRRRADPERDRRAESFALHDRLKVERIAAAARRTALAFGPRTVPVREG